MAELLAYRYQSPPGAELQNTFEVVPTVVHGPLDELVMARAYQRIIQNACRAQYVGVSEEAITALADPNDMRHVREQGDQLPHSLHAAAQPYAPTYFHSRVDLDSSSERYPEPLRVVTGIAKAAFADGRPRLQRQLFRSPEAAANLADVSNLYVDTLVGALPMQQHGHAAGLFRSTLDVYPKDMPTVVYEFPDINPRILPLLKRFHFERDEDFAPREVALGDGGITARMELFKGLLTGDLIELVEKEVPFVAQRERIPSTG